MKIHKLSDVQSKNIGEGTAIWQYCVILNDVQIGRDCNICSHCFIENGVIIGDRVTIKNGVYIFDSVYIEDDVFIGPNVTFTNDSYPRSKRREKKNKIVYPKTIVSEGASIGGGATILPGIIIGKKAIIGAGAIITKNVKDGTIVYGNSGKVRRKISDV
jgi:UDP-2-acetamido-3-amino-2,3-dideoxy-glucuronate N-acetyltransferase